MKEGDIMIVDGVRHKLVECKGKAPCETCSLHSKCRDCEILCNSDVFYCHFEKIEEPMSEIKINIPEGMEIDEENSTFECIKFKPVEKKRWRDDENIILTGYYVNIIGQIIQATKENYFSNSKDNYSIFATEKQAKSALAMTRISQIMANDERFGGVITDEEWNDDNIAKHSIYRNKNEIIKDVFFINHNFLSFHTKTQRNLFLKENEDLVKDYLMID